MSDILYTLQTDGSVESVGAHLEQAASEHKFGVLGVVDITAKMAEKGVPFKPACRIYEVCNPQRAKRVLEENLHISTALPCRISVFETAGRITLSTIRPTCMLEMFHEPALQPVAEQVEEEIRAIMQRAVALEEGAGTAP